MLTPRLRARSGSEAAVSVVRTALGGISEWFDEYIATEEVGLCLRVPLQLHMIASLGTNSGLWGTGRPCNGTRAAQGHGAAAGTLLGLQAQDRGRCVAVMGFTPSLLCTDCPCRLGAVLELTQGNRRVALCTVVGLLEDGETYSTVLKQRQKPEVRARSDRPSMPCRLLTCATTCIQRNVNNF